MRGPARWRRALRRAAAVGAGGGAAAAAAGSASGAGGSAEVWRPGQAEVPRRPRWPGPAARRGEPVYTRRDVSRRDGSAAGAGRVWVTYRDGVYDVTDFRDLHPGGHYIDQAAGGPVDGFWRLWSWHHLSDKVPPLLESMRIGRLGDWDPSSLGPDIGVHYQDEPTSRPAADTPQRGGGGQRPFFLEPFCSETRAGTLAASYLTAPADFFVRNHAPVPADDGDDHQVSFRVLRAGAAEPEEIASLSVGELRRRFAAAAVPSVLQCSGNRASESLSVFGPSGFTGTPFAGITTGMMGHAVWEGARLADVLRAVYPADALSDERGTRHVLFDGIDDYGASVPLSRAAGGGFDALLCWGMNGGPLPRDHGSPVRALIPGVTGARNVKWLSAVTVADGESPHCWQTKYYKAAPGGASLQELPLQSMVLTAERAAAGGVRAAGVAFGGGSGSGVRRVEVSADRGATWRAAELVADAPPRAPDYGWVRWHAELPAAPGGGGGEVWCRAADRAGRQQAEVPAAKLNGYLYAGWSKVPVAPAAA